MATVLNIEEHIKNIASRPSFKNRELSWNVISGDSLGRESEFYKCPFVLIVRSISKEDKNDVRVICLAEMLPTKIYNLYTARLQSKEKTLDLKIDFFM